MLEQNLLFQDNLSTLRLATNGSMSLSKRTKHIKARYYFIKDKVEEGEVEVQYCPTDKMWSDVFNKPKQGLPFRTDRAMLMNVPVDYDDDKELVKTHAALLPESAGSENLALPNLEQPVKASRSVLGNIKNVKLDHQVPGITGPGKTTKSVSWSEVMRGRDLK